MRVESLPGGDALLVFARNFVINDAPWGRRGTIDSSPKTSKLCAVKSSFDRTPHNRARAFSARRRVSPRTHAARSGVVSILRPGILPTTPDPILAGSGAPPACFACNRGCTSLLWMRGRRQQGSAVQPVAVMASELPQVYDSRQTRKFCNLVVSAVEPLQGRLGL